MIKAIEVIFFLSLFLSQCVQAESVTVNVKGEVELENFNCSKTNRCLSDCSNQRQLVSALCSGSKKVRRIDGCQIFQQVLQRRH